MIAHENLTSPEYKAALNAHKAAEAECARLKAALATEDSKKLEAELRVELDAARKQERKLGYEATAIHENLFINALANAYAVKGNPKLGKCYSIAYDMGHSCGYNEVENYFSQLVELIK